MRGYRSIIVVIGLLTMRAMGISAQPRSPGELTPLFERLKSSDLTVKNQASQELHAYAQWWLKQDVATMRKSLPVALERLRDPSPAVRRQASAFFGAAAMMRRDDAAQILGGMVEEIISHLDDPDGRVRGNMIRALALWKPAPPQAAITPLLEALEDPSGEVRSLAVYGLVRAAPENDSVAQAIADALDSMGLEARRGMIQSLANAQAEHPIIVQKLIEQLANDHRLLIYTTARALGAIGTAARSAIPRLREIADDPETDPEIRGVVRSALQSIEKGSSRNRPNSSNAS